MIGTIIGDIAGSRFEFCNRKIKEFEREGQEENCKRILGDEFGRAGVGCGLA